MCCIFILIIDLFCLAFSVTLPGPAPKWVGIVTLDMTEIDRKDEHGRTICNIPKVVKAIVRAGMEEIRNINKNVCKLPQIFYLKSI